MYKTKETAIRNIKAGKNFWIKDFQLFWDDKEVVIEAFKQNPNIFDHSLCGMKGEWRWDEELVSSLFLWVMENCPFSVYRWEPRSMYPYLPPSIVSSKEVAIKAAYKEYFGLYRYLDDELRWDSEVMDAFKREVESTKYLLIYHTKLLRENKEFLMDLIEFDKGIYPHLSWELKDRDTSLWYSVVSQTFKDVPSIYREDPRFVFSALKEVKKKAPTEVAKMMESASYRIRKLVKNNDPINFFEKYLLAEELSINLVTQRQEHKHLVKI